MSDHLNGRYIKTEPLELHGETAMLIANSNGGFDAQFDNLERFSRHSKDWAFGWHSFEAEDFALTKYVEFDDDD